MDTNLFLGCIRNIFLARNKADEKVAKQFQLAPIDIKILAFLYHSPQDGTATAIEREWKFKKNTISVHVDNLVRLGMLERREETNDRRKVVLILTDKAKEVIRILEKENELLIKNLEEGLSEEELNMMYRCFNTINDNALQLINSYPGDKNA